MSNSLSDGHVSELDMINLTSYACIRDPDKYVQLISVKHKTCIC